MRKMVDTGGYKSKITNTTMDEKQYKAYAKEIGYEVRNIHYKNIGSFLNPVYAICGTWVRKKPKQKVGRGARARRAKRTVPARHV